MRKTKFLLIFSVSTIFLASALLSTTPRPPIKAGGQVTKGEILQYLYLVSVFLYVKSAIKPLF